MLSSKKDMFDLAVVLQTVQQETGGCSLKVRNADL